MQSHGAKNAKDKERMAREIGKMKELTVPNTRQVTLLSSLRWFNKEFAEKGISSDAIKAHLQGDVDGTQNAEGPTAPAKLQSVEELLALSYLSYLEQNNFLMADKRYLFSDLLLSSDGILAQVGDAQSEQIFLFLEMWKVFFPGGDPLVAPVSLQQFDSQFRVQSPPQSDQSSNQFGPDE